jgi:NitT/TauT family transport system substrate-binding protein
MTRKHNPLLRFFLLGTAALLVAAGCSSSGKSTTTATTAASGPVTSVKMVLGWVILPEYAGFYAANALGYYKAVGLNVSIQPGGPDVNTEQLVGAGSGEFGDDAYDNVLASNDAGTDLVSLAQIMTRPGLRLISLKSKNLADPSTWRGKTIGIFSSDNPLYATFSKEGIDPNKDVKLVQQGADMSQFLSGQLDLASAYTFNEVGQVVAGGIPLSDLNLFDYTSNGTSTLEDQIFGNGDYVKAHPDVAAKFVAASLKGWVYCRDHASACVSFISKAGSTFPQGFALWSMNTFNQLLWPSPQGFGVMNPAQFQNSANILFSNKVIKTAPTISNFMMTNIYNQAISTLSGVDLKGAGYTPIPNLSPK